MKKQEGITLIALVITIIVLLILAGVTIAMLSGENGILSRATQSRTYTRITNTEDIISVNIADSVSEYYEEVYVNNQSSLKMGKYVKEALDKAVGGIEANITVTYSGITDSLDAAGLVGQKITITDTNTGKKAEGEIKSNGIIIWGDIN